MPGLKVAPTKSNLLRAKESLKLATEGHDLLNEKREVLLMELMGIVHELKRVREQGEQKLAEAYSALESALITMGEEDVSRISSILQREVDMEILERSIMGVVVPTVKLSSVSVGADILVSETSSAFDQARARFVEFVDILGRWAQIEISIFRLATELRKMQRRVKALDNIFIPDYEATVSKIERILEEVDREEFFRKKIMKKRLERSRKFENHI